jgi:4-amino-4-deoxy-L-arabinose transferase-like glycosyltransferase
MSSTTRYRLTVNQETLPLVAIAATTIAVRLWIGPRTVDDAYITFRYAHNIARGVGFVYNAGEKVLGTTTPLFTLILAISHLLVGNLEVVAMVINAIADAGIVVIMYSMVARTTNRSLAAMICALLIAFSAGSIRFTVGGMETGVFVFLIVASCWLFLGERYLPSGIAVALATLTRPEGLILLVAMGGVYLLRHRRFPWKPAIAAVVVLLPWFVFAVAYFGSPIPHSVVAKRSVYHFPLLVALKSLLGYLIGYTFPLSGAAFPRLLKYAFYLAFLLLGGAAAYRTCREEPNFAAFWLFPVIYIGAYAIANPPVWEWYAVPLVPFSASAVAVGVAELAGFIKGRLALPERSLFWQPVLPAVLLLAGVYQVVYIEHHDPRQGRS